MRVVLVTGGARSGKSAWAEAEAHRLGGDDVTFLATARPLDAEMQARIRAHRSSRPPAWRTLEVPVEVPEALAEAAAAVVLLDCVTLWVANLLGNQGEPGEVAVRGRVERLLGVAGARPGTLVAVTNEVGLGIVPANPLARLYRDTLGAVNGLLASYADRVVLMVSGIPMVVRESDGSAQWPDPRRRW